MFRLWGKIWKDNHLLKDTVICDDSEDTRTHKIFRGLESKESEKQQQNTYSLRLDYSGGIFYNKT